MTIEADQPSNPFEVWWNEITKHWKDDDPERYRIIAMQAWTGGLSYALEARERVCFTTEERAAVAVLVQHAAKRCGGGEDTLGAILYTGASIHLENEDEAIVNLAKKIDKHLPPGSPEDWREDKQ